MKTKIAGLAAAVGALSLCAALPAAAATFVTVGDDVTVTYDGFGGDPAVVIPGLTAEIVFTLDAINGSDWTFSYDITNTSTITASRISGFAFDVDPDITGASIAGTFVNAHLNAGLPNVAANLDVCFNNKNVCQGGGGSGVDKGGTGGGTFVLTFNGTPGEVDLTNFHVRYQSVEGAFNGATSAIGRGTEEGGGGGNEIPEPGTWALMILGFGAAGTMLRRRKAALA